MTLETARRLEGLGYTVIPVQTVGPDQRTCSCPRGRNCTDAGKHPVGKEWQKAEGGVKSLEEILVKRRRINVGIRPGDYRETRDGKEYALMVLDIDPRNGGDETMRTYRQKHGALPTTRVVATGSGGWHYYFLIPTELKTRGSIPRGVDVKTSGMVVAEGSRSASGEYLLLADEPVALAPDWLLEEVGWPEGEEFTTKDVPVPLVRLDESDPALPAKKRYCDAAYASILRQIDECKERQTSDMESYRGPDWNNTLYNEACSAYELANTPEALLSPEQVTEELSARMPRDGGFTNETVRRTLESARNKVGDSARDLSSVKGPQFEGTTLRQVAGIDFPDLKAAPSPFALMQGRTFKDADVADTFVESHLGELRFVPGLGWHRWNGTFFQHIEDEAVYAISASMAQSIAVEAIRSGTPQEAKEAQKRLQFAAARDCVKLASGQDRIRVDASGMDCDTHLLNTPSGIVDLRDGMLQAHDPSRLMTKITRSEYRREAAHPDVERALSVLRGDALDWMQLRFGQALTGETPTDDKLAILHGGGSNGKSALMDALMYAVGTYGVPLSERVLVAVEGAHPTEMTDVRGARIAFLEELPSAGTLSPKRIKNLVGTDVMTARKMYQNSISWHATHTVFVTTNHHPKIVDTDHGTWRRLALVDFPYRYVAPGRELTTPNDREGDPELRARLKHPLQQQALLAWAVRGAVRYYALGKKMPPMPPSVQEDTENWQLNSNPLARFLQDHVEVTPEAVCIPSMVLHAIFSDWLRTQGHSAWSETLLGERLSREEMAQSPMVKKTRTRLTYSEDPNRWRPDYPPGFVGQTYADGQQIVAWRGLKWKHDVSEKAPSPLTLAASNK